jgi:ankyrin repeat protein
MRVATPLIKAAKHRDLVALKDAIRSGADLNEMDSQGWTPLFHAAAKGWAEGMKTIIEAGANVNHGRENGFTALFSAVISGHLEAVEILLEAGADVLDVQGIKLTGHAQGKERTQIVAALERAMQSE